jgi:hypothetical protein
MPCVFCRSGGPMSAEHVIPEWTQPFLGDGAVEPGTRTRTTIRRGEGVDETSHPALPATLTVRSVCKACNEGWMSDLETKAKPFLASMLNGHGREYHAGGRTLIATWLVKTALVAGSKFAPALPSQFYSDLYATKQPSPNTQVWLAAGSELNMHSHDFRPITVSNPEEPLPTQPNTFSSVIAVGQLAGFVVSWLDAKPGLSRLRRFRPALVPLWPLSAARCLWPPQKRLDYDGLDRLADTVVHAGDVEHERVRPNV